MQRPPTRRVGTLRYVGPSRPDPSLNRSERGISKRQFWSLTQNSRGPKNQGRSLGLDERLTRQFEKALSMLIRLQELRGRGAANPQSL
jgi:hypothetical protein